MSLVHVLEDELLSFIRSASIFSHSACCRTYLWRSLIETDIYMLIVVIVDSSLHNIHLKIRSIGEVFLWLKCFVRVLIKLGSPEHI